MAINLGTLLLTKYLFIKLSFLPDKFKFFSHSPPPPPLSILFLLYLSLSPLPLMSMTDFLSCLPPPFFLISQKCVSSRPYYRALTPPLLQGILFNCRTFYIDCHPLEILYVHIVYMRSSNFVSKYS